MNDLERPNGENSMDSNRKLGLLAATFYLGCIVGANWAINRYGLVPVGFGLKAPAGVYFVGVAFTMRDVTQRLLGARWTVAAVVAGTVLSAFVSPALAFASGTAFFISEMADFITFTALVKRGRAVVAVVASNTVGAVLDSIVFLWLAFGSLAYLNGQIVGKMMMTLLALPMVWVTRRWFAQTGRG